MPEMLPVGNTIQPPPPINALQSLSGILGIKQQQQNLQTGQSLQATAAAQAQQQQLAASQQQGVQNFFQSWDPSAHHTDDGTVDVDSAVQSPQYQSAGNAKPGIMQALLDIKNKQISNKTELAKLNGTLVSQFGQQVNTLAKDPDVVADQTDPATGINPGRAKVNELIRNYGQLGPDQQRIAQIYGPNLAKVAPGKLSGAVGTIGAQAATVPEQYAQTNPRQLAIQRGGQQDIYNVQPSAGLQSGQQPAASIANTLPPQTISQPITGAPAMIGGAAGTTPQPIGGQGRTGPSPWQPYAGQGADIQNYQNEVQATRAEAQQAPLAHNINQQILRLADSAKTGPGTEIWQHAVGALGAPLGLSPTASYQELGKFLEKNAINNMQAMGGPPSDTRLSAAAAANGSTTFSPEALKKVTKFNDATTSALAQYRQGMDAAVGMGQNVNYTNLPAYKAAWAKNFDVDIFRVNNAMQDGDTKELHNIAVELGPERLKALAQKRENLIKLSQTGTL